ncbi:protein SOB FIVE-LIKE 4-like [Magnolia sinica]|uniref:protein SOB FIVE-LIKE 4-like n=1 Tax=Magnolia sinica TaxID=86752 RepID=UPI00265A0185|nr:protein SOB FIVE-LIKE 4-like [Magnolia sinica]
MESSSQIIGVTEEERNSSESGWTMYLASPMHDDDDGDGSEHDGVGGGGYGDDDSDDSMASDASSGPCRREHSYENTDLGHCMGHSKHDDDDDGDDGEEEDYGYSYKKVSKQKEKRKDEGKRNEREKEGPLHADRNSSLVCSSSKVRKINLVKRGKQ